MWQRETEIRETREELGLELKDSRLIVVDYRHTQAGKEEMLHFVFFGGILTDIEKSKIKLQADELKAHRFVNIEEVYKLCGIGIGQRVERALEAIRSNTAIYWDF
ncbi:MAG TPA: NUDIX domain-containing protein [Candidatus Paceibacterota bacterium]